MRIIFQAPIELNSHAIRFSFLVNTNNGSIMESELADILDIPERDVRTIAERFNYNLYLNVDNGYQFKKINGMYHVIDKHSEYRNQVRAKIKTDALSALKRWRVTEHKLGDVNLMNMTMQELLDMEAQDE